MEWHAHPHQTANSVVMRAGFNDTLAIWSSPNGCGTAALVDGPGFDVYGPVSLAKDTTAVVGLPAGSANRIWPQCDGADSSREKGGPT